MKALVGTEPVNKAVQTRNRGGNDGPAMPELPVSYAVEIAVQVEKNRILPFRQPPLPVATDPGIAVEASHRHPAGKPAAAAVFIRPRLRRNREDGSARIVPNRSGLPVAGLGTAGIP